MDIQSLSGRDLDAMVAQHVFGLVVEPRDNSRTGQHEFVYEVHPGQWVRVAYYASSMSASITLEVALKDRGWTRKAGAGGNWSGPGDVHVILEHTDGRTVEATGRLNEALCRAALKAIAL